MFKKFISILTFLFVMSFYTNVFAIDLVYIYNDNCSFCDSFKNEILNNYKSGKFNKVFPITIVNYNNGPPKWLDVKYGLIRPIKGLPSFLLYDRLRNREIARIDGYKPGKPGLFYGKLKTILKYMRRNGYRWL